MNKDELIKLLEEVDTPIYQIESEIGMPKTTLQKAIKGQRDLPKRWRIKLLAKYPPKTNLQLQESQIKEKPIGGKQKDEKQSVETKNNLIPPMPIKNEGEDAIDFAIRKNEWKTKYGQK